MYKLINERPSQLGQEFTNCITAEGYNSPKECPGNDTKLYDGELSVILEHWGMQSILSLLSLPGPLCPEVVASDKVLSIGQIE